MFVEVLFFEAFDVLMDSGTAYKHAEKKLEQKT